MRFAGGNLQRIFDLLLPFDNKGFWIELRGLHLSQEYRALAAIAGIVHIHAYITAFEKFFLAHFGILKKTGHDTDAAHIITDLEQLSFLQHHLLRMHVDGSLRGCLAIKKGGEIRIGYGLEGLAPLSDLDFKAVAVIQGKAMLRLARAGAEMPLPDAGDVLCLQ